MGGIKKMINLTKDNVHDFINSPSVESAVDSNHFYFKIPSNWGNVFIKSKIENPLGSGDFNIPEYKVYNKIPVYILLQLQDFFKDIYAKYKTEVFAFILQDREDGHYTITIPEQTVSSSSVEYKPHVDDEYKLIANVHSHHNMGAFFSSIDDEDDKNNTSLSIVLADLDSFLPEIKIRTWVYNKFISINPLDVFYFEPYMGNSDMFNDVISDYSKQLYKMVLQELLHNGINKSAFAKIVNTHIKTMEDYLFKKDNKYDYRILIDEEVISNTKYNKIEFDERKIKEKKIYSPVNRYADWIMDDYMNSFQRPKYNGQYKKDGFVKKILP